MKNRCLICLKYYSNKANLKRHEKVVCKQKFECNLCLRLYSSRQQINIHKCKPKKNNNQIELTQNDLTQNDLINNLPNDRQIIINNNNNNVYNITNETNTNSKNELNNNSKNDNKVMNNNFMNTDPKNFNFDYIIKEGLLNNISKYINMDGYKEEEADQFMYEEDKFKQQDEEVRRKYEKDPLKVEGMKEFFTELQKEPNNRNVVIKKSKSGKCQVYDTSWNEKGLKDITTKLCNKVCDTLFDKETSINHFMREVMGSQPGRCRMLRNHIQKEIRSASKMIKEELDMIE